MEPTSIIGLLSNVGEAVSLLKQCYESIRDAPEGLAIVVSQASSFQQELDRVSSMQRLLPEKTQQYLEEQIKTEECVSTIQELQLLVKRIKPTWESLSGQSETDRAKEQMKLKERIKWLWSKDDAKKLAEKLARQADRVFRAMISAMLYVET